MNKNNSIIMAAVVALIIGGGAGFFGGIQYQKSHPTGRGVNGQFVARGQGRFGANGFQPVRGQILSVDNNSMTVKLPDGSSKLVVLSDSTNVTEATNAGKQALQTGQQVLVLGTTNSDGSVTAQNVSLNPPMGGGRMNGGNNNGSGQ